MSDSRRKPDLTARQYLRTKSAPPQLGFGAEGCVFQTDRSTAIKVFTYREKFLSELAAYQRLKQKKIVQVEGFAIPQLLKFSAKRMVIEMTIVRPPFVVDFSQSKIDEEPDFPEGLDEWWNRLADMFGEQKLLVVQRIFYELASSAGLYYYDIHPKNVNFGD